MKGADSLYTVTRNCINCGKEFETQLKEIRRGKGKYCSLRCAGHAGGKAFHAKYDIRGMNNPNYKDGNWQSRKYQYKLNYRRRHPEAAKAHDIVRNAVRHGRLIKQPCHICGSTINVHAHHEDYSKPLDVIWLCDKCHRIRHGATG